MIKITITLTILILLLILINYKLNASTPKRSRPTTEWNLNTSNPGKLSEFQQLFGKFGINLSNTQIDLPEIDADPVSVIAHKASQLPEFTLVEDTSLDIEGAQVGINIRWLLDHLSDYIGKQAKWTVFLGYRQGHQVVIYKGEVSGTIVSAQGTNGFGFDSFFKPNGSDLTLAQFKPDNFNARAMAVEALVKDNKFDIVEAIYHWDGPWQQH